LKGMHRVHRTLGHVSSVPTKATLRTHATAKRKLDVNVRLAGVSDLPSVARLFDAYRVFYKLPSDLKVATAFMKDRLQNKDSVIFVAETKPEKEVVGFVQLYPSFASLSCKRSWILYDLFVTPNVRGSSVGRMLMDRATQLGLETGASEIELATALDNYVGQSLYESIGYKKDQDFFHYALDLSTVKQSK